MAKLLHNYISVNKDGQYSYGGNQLWSEDAVMRRCGCGVIAAADLLLYLGLYTPCCDRGLVCEFEHTHVVSHKDYEALTAKLRKSFLQVFYPVGMNGLSLSIGLNLYFSRWKLPFRASWGVTHGRLWDKMEQMLLEDIPVIFAVGPNFPFVWQNNRVNFYSKAEDGYKKTNSARAHYIMLTGMDEEWLKISSWGRLFYVKKTEFIEYSKKHSLDLLSNMLYIRKK